jgi:hypothetical protein
VTRLATTLFLLCQAMVFSVSAAPARVTVLISDTHLGVGRTADGNWDPTEDFRWPEAFAGFLRSVNERYGSHLDLVILGDFLELWQPPITIPCKGAGPELGCTVQEMTALTTLVTQQHSRDLATLAAFAAEGDNHVYVVPGNHDSALLLPTVWSVLAAAIHAEPGRVTRVDSGVWTSADNLVRAEHGHQIGEDVNRYRAWPAITATQGGVEYLVRPWGAQFVQALYNDVERQYPIIDNLGPESAGARYLLAGQSAGRSASDLARLLAFNLFETSIRQKLQVLAAPPPDPDPAARWNLNYARTLGAALFKGSLDHDDPLQGILSSPSPADVEFQQALAALLKTLPQENVIQLCELAVARGHDICTRQQSGALLQSLINTKDEVIRAHLVQQRAFDSHFAFFVYGHTHQLEIPWPLRLTTSATIKVANTGAFQRLIDEDSFKALMKTRHLDAKNALRSVSLEELPACYTYVVVETVPRPLMSVLRWHQEEGGKAGNSVPVGDTACN